MADVLDVAEAVIQEITTSEIDNDPTAMKLEKLVYYSQVWHLAETGEVLFGDPIEAWSEGPIVRRLWDRHRGALRVRSTRFGDRDRLSASQIELIRRIVDRYGRLSAERLSALTHNEVPWRATRRGLPDSARCDWPIDVDLMRTSYSHVAASPDEAVDLAIASSRLEGLTTPESSFSILHAVASGELDVEDAIRARIAAIKG